MSHLVYTGVPQRPALVIGSHLGAGRRSSPAHRPAHRPKSPGRYAGAEPGNAVGGMLLPCPWGLLCCRCRKRLMCRRASGRDCNDRVGYAMLGVHPPLEAATPKEQASYG